MVGPPLGAPPAPPLLMAPPLQRPPGPPLQPLGGMRPNSPVGPGVPVPPLAPLVPPPRPVLGAPKLSPSVIQAAPTVYSAPPAKKGQDEAPPPRSPAPEEARIGPCLPAALAPPPALPEPPPGPPEPPRGPPGPRGPDLAPPRPRRPRPAEPFLGPEVGAEPAAEDKKKGRPERLKRCIRTAAGSSWEDPSLLEWDADDFRIFCGDLGNEVNDDILARAFGRYPSFLKAKVIRDKRTGKTKGYGFVSFKDPNDYVRAMREMNGKYVGSRPIKLRKSMWKDRNLDVVRKKQRDDNILVTHEDQIPVVEIDDTYSCLLMQDFLWFTKVSCMWDEILWLRQCVTVSQSSCSCILQTRFKMLLAISQMQGLLGIQDLGQVFFEPIKDKQGNILIVTLKEVKTNQTFESVRWVPICKLQTSRKSVSSPEEPTALDTLLISVQDKLAYHQRSSHALSPGLYLGYLKLCSAVDQIRVLVPEQLPNILCHVKIRSNPNISREEWEWLQKMASMEEPVSAEPQAETSQNHLFQELQAAIKELMTLVNIPLQEAKDFRLYSQEVLDFGGQVSFLLLLPPSDDVCTAPGQNNPYTPQSGFLTLPLQIFELVHFFTYDREFIMQYCQVSALLELESLLSQQSLREAFSDAELSTAKQRHQQVQDYIQQMEEIWREMRWIMDALQHARYKQPSCGVSLSGFLSTSSSAMKEKTQSSSSHLDFLPSPAPSPETSRKLNSDLHGLSDEEGSSEVFLATDSDYDSSRAQSPKELDLVSSSSGPECCGRRATRSLRDSAPDVLQSHELQPVPLPPPEPRPPPELYDSDFVLPSRQIELLRITEKRQAYCVRTSSLDFPKPLCPVARKSCPGSVDSSPTESRTPGGHGSQLRLGTGSAPSPERGRTRSAEWTPSFQEPLEQPGCLADRGKKPGSVTLRVCPQYETGLSKETSVKLHITSQTSAGEVVKLVVLEMNDVSRGVLGGSAAFCYGEEQLEHFGLVFASEESERWLPDDFLPLSLHAARPEGRFYVRIKETSPLVLQFGPATTV